VKILVINCGSSSIKYQLIESATQRALAQGVVSRIGEEISQVIHRAHGEEIKREMRISSAGQGLELAIGLLLEPRLGVLQHASEISAVGHRIVHGGVIFFDSVIVTDEVIAKIEECAPLAPLHNPPSLLGIRAALKILPGIPHVAVFDTSFHQTMPARAFTYALPTKFYEAHKVRRYGFHGTSIKYVSGRAATLVGKPLEELDMVVCHLGNGVSISAIKGGKSIDTSMGLTPLEGAVMGTRSGDIDPGVIFFLHRHLGLTIDDIDDLLNKRSGLLGLSGISNDMREIAQRSSQGDARCRLALEIFAYRVKKYVGAYAAALGGMDALVFTAGIGENFPSIRTMICEGLGFLGIELDIHRNERALATETVISNPDHGVAVLVVPTNEELMIALETASRLDGLALKTI
jgi:acetate kinase